MDKHLKKSSLGEVGDLLKMVLPLPVENSSTALDIAIEIITMQRTGEKKHTFWHFFFYPIKPVLSCSFTFLLFLRQGDGQ